MAQRSPSPHAAPDRRKVLTKAVIRAARALALNQSRVAATLGVSDPTVSRMFAEKYLLDPARKEWELGALFVRLFRSLDSIVASDEKARAWLSSENRGPGLPPRHALSLSALGPRLALSLGSGSRGVLRGG